MTVTQYNVIITNKMKTKSQTCSSDLMHTLYQLKVIRGRILLSSNPGSNPVPVISFMASCRECNGWNLHHLFHTL